MNLIVDISFEEHLYIHLNTDPILVTVNLTDAQTDAHIVRIDFRCVIHNLRVELMYQCVWCIR